MRSRSADRIENLIAEPAQQGNKDIVVKCPPRFRKAERPGQVESHIRYFTGTGMPGIFTLVMPRWLRLVK